MGKKLAMRGGRRTGAGRPKGTTKPSQAELTLQKQIRWSEEEWSMVESAATAVEETASEFVRKAVMLRIKGP